MSIEVHQPEIEALIQQPAVVDERLTDGLRGAMSAEEGISGGWRMSRMDAHGQPKRLDEFRQRHSVPHELAEL